MYIVTTSIKGSIRFKKEAAQVDISRSKTAIDQKRRNPPLVSPSNHQK